jgi:nicotinate-nucleotide adenylyltransferase
MSGRRIGLFGGTFDPPHRGHVALARAARDALALDELRWVPAGAPWQKLGPGARPPSPAADRVEMVRLAIEGEPRFVLDTAEVERAGPSYTLDTVREMQAREPGAQWFLVIGADQHARLHTWHGVDELLRRIVPAVAARPGEAPHPAPEVARHAHVAVPMAPADVSSTEIRRRAAAGEDVSALVPSAVAGYIERARLYRPAHH